MIKCTCKFKDSRVCRLLGRDALTFAQMVVQINVMDFYKLTTRNIFLGSSISFVWSLCCSLLFCVWCVGFRMKHPFSVTVNPNFLKQISYKLKIRVCVELRLSFFVHADSFFNLVPVPEWQKKNCDPSFPEFLICCKMKKEHFCRTKQDAC